MSISSLTEKKEMESKISNDWWTIFQYDENRIPNSWYNKLYKLSLMEKGKFEDLMITIFLPFYLQDLFVIFFNNVWSSSF